MAMVNPPSIANEDGPNRRRLIYQLRQAGGPFNWQLAAVLEGCSPFRRCRSGACIVCGREMQMATAGLIEREIREPARQSVRGRMSMATIIPASGIVPPDGLTMQLCQRVVADLTTVIRAFALVPSIWGFDISFNEDEEGQLPSHWAGHAHGVFIGWLSPDDKNALRAAVEKSPFVRKRVHIDRLDGRANAPLYAIKPDRERRVGYVNDKHSTRAPHRDTRHKPLRPDQAVALAQVEHEIGLLNRLLITGINKDAVRTALKGFYWPQDGP